MSDSADIGGEISNLTKMRQPIKKFTLPSKKHLQENGINAWSEEEREEIW